MFYKGSALSFYTVIASVKMQIYPCYIAMWKTKSQSYFHKWLPGLEINTENLANEE